MNSKDLIEKLFEDLELDFTAAKFLVTSNIDAEFPEFINLKYKVNFDYNDSGVKEYTIFIIPKQTTLTFYANEIEHTIKFNASMFALETNKSSSISADEVYLHLDETETGYAVNYDKSYVSFYTF